MTDARRTQLRKIMLLAWRFRRDEPARDFADCLRGAWTWTKAMAKTAAAMMARAARNGGRLAFGSPVTSPLQRATAGLRNPGYADKQAAGLTARISW